ncbi:MAG: HlyD family secretion protein [Isosphaera sp.]|nr:HlyD family secretion protein [Isosphaera sp.]
MTDPAPESPRPRSRAWVVWAVLALAGVGAAAYLGWPLLARALDTVSTDDAYVTGHVTFVAPRVAGQVTRVYVDDNYRVKTGEKLLELDPEPYQKVVDIRQAAVDQAKADRVAAETKVASAIAQARAQKWKLELAGQLVDDQIAGIKAKAAAYRSQVAIREKADADLGRAKEGFDKGAISQEQLDQRREAVKVAQALATQALDEVYEARAALGLPQPGGTGPELTAVPADLNQTHASVRQALADLVQTLTDLGYPLADVRDTPRQFLDRLREYDAGETKVLLEKVLKTAPAVKQADARLAAAEADLAAANLNLSYCTVYAGIDGVVTRRNVNPGNNVQTGQQVMAVRSLTEIWVEANFKETSLDYLAIGHPVDLEVDMYGSKKRFRGRISGFTYGTGQTLALLPPQNATGNFVKVTQRLPVRIHLEGYDPNGENPLFAGLSVVPYVRYKDAPTGPDAGKRLQTLRDGR